MNVSDAIKGPPAPIQCQTVKQEQCNVSNHQGEIQDTVNQRQPLSKRQGSTITRQALRWLLSSLCKLENSFWRTLFSTGAVCLPFPKNKIQPPTPHRGVFFPGVGFPKLPPTGDGGVARVASEGKMGPEARCFTIKAAACTMAHTAHCSREPPSESSLYSPYLRRARR